MSGKLNIYQNSNTYQSTSRHPSNFLYLNFIVLFFAAVISTPISAETQSNIETRHLAVEVGTDVVFNCTSNKRTIWSKIISDGDSATVEFIYVGTQLYDVGLADKFSINHVPRTPKRNASFDLILSKATLQDSGKYLCNQNLAVFLTVIQTPSCSPNKNIHKENLQVVFKCKVRYSGLEGAPTLEWLLDDEVMYPHPHAGIDNIRSTTIDEQTIVKTLEWKPRSEHNRRNVRCVVKHPYLKLPPEQRRNNSSVSAAGTVVVDDGKGDQPQGIALELSALPFCGFTPLDVRFRPRVLCPHEFLVPQESYDEASEEEDEAHPDDENVVVVEERKDAKRASLVDEAAVDDMVRRRRRARKRARRANQRFELRHLRQLDHHHHHHRTRFPRAAAGNTSDAKKMNLDEKVDDTAVIEEESQRKLMYSCEVYANPLPGEGSMYWKRGSDGDRIYVGSEDESQVVLVDGRKSGGDRMKVGFYVPIEDLSERLPHMRVALSVPLHGKSMMETVTDVHYVFGPYLSCPPHVYLSNKGSSRGAASDRGGGGVLGSKTFLITCRVRIHPPLEEGNVSWSLDGDAVSPVNSYVQLPLPPIGRSPTAKDDDEERLTLVMLKLKEYQVQNRDAQYMLKLHVQGAHHHATSTLKIQWDQIGAGGVNDPDAPNIGASNSDRFLENWIMNHAGLLVMGGILLALGLLSGILLLVLYKQGFICSSSKEDAAAAKKKASSKKDKDRLSKAFPELFHSHRGHRRDEGQHPHHGRARNQNKSPQPHQQQVGIIAHMPRERSNSSSPQTPRQQQQHLLIPAGQPPEPSGARCKTPDSIDGPVSSATADKMTGLAKLGNALYLKDMDQDGFITIVDGRSVLESYNSVYHLSITEARMTELLRLSSNGNYVNIEVIMRLLITSSQKS